MGIVVLFIVGVFYVLVSYVVLYWFGVVFMVVVVIVVSWVYIVNIVKCLVGEMMGDVFVVFVEMVG